MTLIISRSVTGASGIDFARQLREQNASLNPTTSKKFRSTAAPKGSRLASGYQDRTQLRTTVEEDEKATRIKSLEEMVKLGQMEQATFEALRDEIVGGNVKDVHLVKGLDWKLLERVRRGEDVLNELAKAVSDRGDGLPMKEESNPDVDEALESLEEKEVKPLAKEQKAKKGAMAPPSLAGRKRNRDEILRELKASRLKAEEDKKAQQPSLGPKFKKVDAKQEKSRIERDERGREILITVDGEGRVKRKVKKVKVETDPKLSNGLLMPDKDAKPLGMEIPEAKAPVILLEEDNGDIFEDAGNDYDPLGGMQDEDDSDTSDEDGIIAERPIDDDKPVLPLKSSDTTSITEDTSPSRSTANMPPPPVPIKSVPAGRNYFGDPSPSKDDDSITKSTPLADQTILAALKKASTISPLLSSSDPSNAEEAAILARRKKLLDSHDRDAEDMDMGFGSSRFEDEEDGEERKVKLSVWGKDSGDHGEKEDGKGKRKRGPKKRKGDVNSAADVLKVMERRKGEGK